MKKVRCCENSLQLIVVLYLQKAVERGRRFNFYSLWEFNFLMDFRWWEFYRVMLEGRAGFFFGRQRKRYIVFTFGVLLYCDRLMEFIVGRRVLAEGSNCFEWEGEMKLSFSEVGPAFTFYHGVSWDLIISWEFLFLIARARGLIRFFKRHTWIILFPIVTLVTYFSKCTTRRFFWMNAKYEKLTLMANRSLPEKRLIGNPRWPRVTEIRNFCWHDQLQSVLRSFVSSLGIKLAGVQQATWQAYKSVSKLGEPIFC